MSERRRGERQTSMVRGDQRITRGSGNVFQDLGLPDSAELAAKADLARVIRQLVEARGLSQRAAAPLLGVAQSDLSNLYRSHLDGFSIERLSRMLNALGQDVRIVVRPAPRSRRAGDIRADVKHPARKSA
jgi:predicted XRE-type DNA-binding protein